MRGSLTSRPPGERMCQQCRRARRRTTATVRSPVRSCDKCGREFHPCNPDQRGCSQRCAQQLRFPADVARKRRSCQVCGGEYNATYAEQRTCSRACGAQVRRRRGGYKRKRKPITGVQLSMLVQQCQRCESPFLGWGKRSICYECPSRFKPKPPEHLECGVCRSPFVSAYRRTRGSRPTRYCSKRCRALAYGGRFKVGYQERMALYKRDRHVCHICLLRTWTHVDSAHNWAPTLDHLVPRSRGGGNEPTNLATAHRWCNVMRSDRPWPYGLLEWDADGQLLVGAREVPSWAAGGPPMITFSCAS